MTLDLACVTWFVENMAVFIRRGAMKERLWLEDGIEALVRGGGEATPNQKVIILKSELFLMLAEIVNQIQASLFDEGLFC